MNIADVINYILANLNLVYRPTKDGTDVPKHVGVAKDHTFMYVCNLCINLAL
jgi:hypothetical protein